MDKLVFFDIDGTLVQDNVVADLAFLVKNIASLKNKGLIFGINTNRPWESVRRVYGALKLNGPIILENGASYRKSPYAGAIVGNERARDLNKKVISFFKHNLVELFPGAKLMIGDDKSVLRLGGPLILISKNRRFTASIYLAVGGDSDRGRLAFIAGRLRREFPAGKYFTVQYLPRQNKIIVGNDWRDRIDIMRLVRDRYYPYCKIFMISDNENVPLPRDMFFYATKNALGAYKKRARYSAVASGGCGIVEIIKKIEKTLCIRRKVLIKAGK